LSGGNGLLAYARGKLCGVCAGLEDCVAETWVAPHIRKSRKTKLANARFEADWGVAVLFVASDRHVYRIVATGQLWARNTYNTSFASCTSYLR